MVALKSVTPPLEALAGLEIEGVRRVGKMPVSKLGPEDERLALLVHMMSAGRLQLFAERASLKDRRSRVLIRLADGRELRLREFGTKQRAWAKLMDAADVADDEMVATLGPEAWPAPPLDELAELVDQPRHLHPLLRDQRSIAGIGRSWVDEILWEARLSPFKKGSELADEEVERLHDALAVLGRAIDHYEEVDRRDDPRQDADAAAGPPARGRALPALRRDDRRDPLRRADHLLLPEGADRRPGAGGPTAVAAAEVDTQRGQWRRRRGLRRRCARPSRRSRPRRASRSTLSGKPPLRTAIASIPARSAALDVPVRVADHHRGAAARLLEGDLDQVGVGLGRVDVVGGRSSRRRQSRISSRSRKPSMSSSSPELARTTVLPPLLEGADELGRALDGDDLVLHRAEDLALVLADLVAALVLEPRARRGGRRSCRCRSRRPGEPARPGRATPDPAQRQMPGERVLVVVVDERAVDVEDRGGDGHPTALPAAGSGKLSPRAGPDAWHRWRLLAAMLACRRRRRRQREARARCAWRPPAAAPS